MEKIAVRFIKPSPPFNTGEVAGFYKNCAVDFVRNGVAEFYNNDTHNQIVNEVKAVEEPIPSSLANLLKGTKQEILELILTVNEYGDYALDDETLTSMQFYERQNRNRKGVIKIIEDVTLDRLKA